MEGIAVVSAIFGAVRIEEATRKLKEKAKKVVLNDEFEEKEVDAAL